MKLTVLETERLELRRPSEADLPGWHAFMSDPKVVKTLATDPLDEAACWRMLASAMGHWEMRGYGFFSVYLQETEECVGRIGPWNPYAWPAPEIGWTVASCYWGQGFAPEAARACGDYARTKLGWDRAAHFILPDNIASIAVARKIGARKIGHRMGLPGVPATAKMQLDHYETLL